MKQAISILILTLVATLGCAAFPAKRTPKLDKPRVARELRDAPAIRLVVNDRTDQPKRTAKFLERSRKKFPYLATAGENTLDPDYTIELSVEHNLYPNGVNEFAFYSMLIIPAITTAEVNVRATVTGEDGRVLGTVGSIGKCKRVGQLHLLLALPVTAPLWSHVNNKMWTNSFRDVFIQAAELIAEDQKVATGSRDVSATRTPSF